MSKRFVIILILLAAIIATGAAFSSAWFKVPFSDQFRLSPVERNNIVMVINSTGTVQPVKSVQIGAFVSGPLSEVNVDFNSNVTEGQLLARIDPRLYEAAVARDTAALAHANADLKRVEALYEQAYANEQRAKKLREAKDTYISDMEIDQYKADRKSFEAQVELAKAGVMQSQANLKTSQQNLDYTRIISPVDGMVIDRKVDQGQTVASQFQTPTLFIVAPDLKQRIYVYASVDEADIGMIRMAQEKKHKVDFKVDAWPTDRFEGNVEQIRMNSTTNQNVVTYTVVVAAKNPDLKLWPGMTADLSFEIDSREKVLRIPNAALRFYPKAEVVRPEDRHILEGETYEQNVQQITSNQSPTTIKYSVAEKTESAKNRVHRHVWVVDGEFLRAVPVTTGISSAKYSELVEGDLKEGDQLVAGIKSIAAGAGK